MTETKKQQKINTILSKLNSGDTKIVSKAIKSFESNGDSSVIRPLAELLLSDVSEINTKEILELFSSLKDSDARSEIMQIIDEKQFISIRQLMLSTIWNTKIDFSGYIDEFVDIAINGSFLEAIDCLTIIENLEGPFMEEDLLECESHLKKYMTSNPEKDDQRAFILSEIAINLKKFNNDLED